MKVVIVTPLYPPDIASSAQYVFELATRLSKTNTVTVVTYGRLPEEISGVRTISVDNRSILFVRLMRFIFTLRHAASDADVMYVQNGASVELPSVLVQLITGRKMFIHFVDKDAHERAPKKMLLHILEGIANYYSKAEVIDTPLPRPEILPLESRPDVALSAYEVSWKTHLENLKKLFSS